jgi:Uma2 family endonuclease
MTITPISAAPAIPSKPTSIDPPKQSSIVQPVIKWERLPSDFKLPDDPVENINHPLLAAALREILAIAGLIPLQALIGGNLGIALTVNEQRVVKAPDWFYAPQVNPETLNTDLGSYAPNLDGEIPVVAIEFLSDTDGGEYSSKSTFPYGKWYFYERLLKVPVYAIFNPKDGSLEVHELRDGRYELKSDRKKPDEPTNEPTLDDRASEDSADLYWIEPLKLYLGVWAGTKDGRTGYWLRWWNASGRMLPWALERVEQRFQEGEIQGKLSIIHRYLTRKVGEIPVEVQAQIEALSIVHLDELSDALLDFANLEDLITWLASRSN